jgi:hypothetical protein
MGGACQGDTPRSGLVWDCFDHKTTQDVIAGFTEYHQELIIALSNKTKQNKTKQNKTTTSGRYGRVLLPIVVRRQWQ